MNRLLALTGLVCATVLLKKHCGVSGIGRTWFGGNSGYQGYSMSNRAMQAREEGTYPKTDFKKVYGITENTLKILLDLGIITNNEWHHTSKYGNKTIFYGWEEKGYADIYELYKRDINRLIKNGDISEIERIFSDNIEPYLQEEQRLREEEKRRYEYNQEVSLERERLRNEYQPDIFTASNGAIVVKNENNAVYLDGERLTKRNKKQSRDKALEELKEYLDSFAYPDFL